MAKTASKARIFLFHGNDALMSRRSLQRWEKAFVEKHADLSHHRLYFDKGSYEDLQEALGQIITEQSLFPTPSLYVVYRPTGQEKGKRGSYSEALLKIASQLVKQERDDVTLLIWEEKNLPADHVITKWFQEHEEQGTAKHYDFMVPQNRELMREAAAYLEGEGYSLESAASRLLENYLQEMEKEQRSSARIRSNEVMPVDMRRSWAWNVLESALLAATGSVITLADIQRCAEPIQANATPFEVANAIEKQQWQRARFLLSTWDEESDMGPYFVLLGVLRQRYRTHLPHTTAQYALDLLAEMEVLTKNGISKMAWLLDMFTFRMEESVHAESLLDPRIVWLAAQ